MIENKHFLPQVGTQLASNLTKTLMKCSSGLFVYFFFALSMCGASFNQFIFVTSLVQLSSAHSPSCTPDWFGTHIKCHGCYALFCFICDVMWSSGGTGTGKASAKYSKRNPILDLVITKKFLNRHKHDYFFSV